MSTPAQMFDHELNPLKGWPSPYALDKAADVKSGQPTILAGRVCCLDASSGNLVLGLTANAMPLFAFQNSTDLDVVGDDGNLVGQGTATPRLNTLVATGSYELESTEYDTGTYNANTALTAYAPADAKAGKLVAGTIGTHTVCGIVSAACSSGITNEFKKTVIRFWSVFVPGSTNKTSP